MNACLPWQLWPHHNFLEMVFLKFVIILSLLTKVRSDCNYHLLPGRCLELAVPACCNSVILNLEKLYGLCFNDVLMVETLTRFWVVFLPLRSVVPPFYAPEKEREVMVCWENWRASNLTSVRNQDTKASGSWLSRIPRPLEVDSPKS